MGRIKECAITCFFIVSFFILAILVVFFVTFLLPDILKLEDIEIKGNTSFRAISILENNVSALEEKEFNLTGTSSTVNENAKTSNLSAIESTISTTLPQESLTQFDKSVARLVVDLQGKKIYSPSRKLYADDDLLLVVNSSGGERKAGISLDDAFLGETSDEGLFLIEDLSGKEHEITVEAGELSVDTVIPVWRTRYGLSLDVRELLTYEERRRVIKEGKANLRFYDIPNCPNCIVMRPKVATIVEDYRYCIAYELVNLWKPPVREELKNEFPDQSKVMTPVIIVEGSNGRYSYMGIVPPETLVKNILKVAPACGN